jgi:hypothetical protein
MSFEVLFAPHVSVAVSSLHAQRRFQFEQITARLADSPYPSSEEDDPRRRAILFGRNVFTYYTAAFPYTVIYRVVTDRHPDHGIVIITALAGPTA